MPDHDLYRVLGLAPGATLEEVKRAYRALVKAYHPDAPGGKGNPIVFARVVEAYRRLSQAESERAKGRAPTTRSSYGRQPEAGSPRDDSHPAGRRESGFERNRERPEAGSPRDDSHPAGRRESGFERNRERPEGARREPGAARHATGDTAPAGRGDNSLLDMFDLGRDLLMNPSPFRRASAAQALGASGKKSAYAFLRKALWDREEPVLVAVVRAIGQLGIRQCEGELGSLFSKAGIPVRKEILRAVARIGGAHGFDSIVDLALHDSDPALRAQAGALRKG